MIEINGFKFYDEPGSCGSCPCMNTGQPTSTPVSSVDTACFGMNGIYVIAISRQGVINCSRRV